MKDPTSKNLSFLSWRFVIALLALLVLAGLTACSASDKAETVQETTSTRPVVIAANPVAAEVASDVAPDVAAKPVVEKNIESFPAAPAAAKNEDLSGFKAALKRWQQQKAGKGKSQEVSQENTTAENLTEISQENLLEIPQENTHGFEAGLEAAQAGDFRRAHDLWLAEAEQGHALSQSYLGVLYEKGQGVEKNGARAAEWFRKAAEQGEPTAQTNLGALYSKGHGVEQNDQEAAKWFHKAAEQGETYAKSYLGVIYARGRGVPQDDKKAARWFQMAAMEGDVKAQYSLGVMYDVGRGVQQNKVVSYAWYTLAAEQGDKESQDLRAKLKEKLSPEEITISQQIAEQFRSQIR